MPEEMERASQILLQKFEAHPHISTDTRNIKKGDLFFALKGPNFDGNHYAEEALKAGASLAIVDDQSMTQNDERYLVVDDVLKALQNLARQYRKQFDVPFIAITGSNGKTTTKELTTAVLQKAFKVHATKGNLNNHIGVPLTLLSMPLETEMAIIEMGANHLREIESYCQIAEPDFGLINNIGKAHLEGFGSVEGVRKGKGELYDFIRNTNGTIFRNSNLDYLESLAEDIVQQITYGSEGALYNFKMIASDPFLKIEFQINDTTFQVNSNLVGDYNFDNLMAAVTIGLHFQVDPSAIKSAIESYQPDNSRSQMLKLNGNDIILDAYNANPTSMKAAILNFEKQKGANKILWIGAMKEMGQEEAAEHQFLVDLIKSFDWKQVILVGQEFEHCHADLLWFADVHQAKIFLESSMPNAAQILIKGSRGSKMEILLEAFKKN